ncbi:lipocalin-like domain-containing protein [Paraferrimonas haliotis]|uniref:lipocalin-like domain-containing protein n=1 Tax=Paraferrimonas haliotis TaxID=2013866 RepID=UPI000BA9C3F1|nr:lipocalin-like domain-containing protein [Paraferrimonas haliotis]
MKYLIALTLLIAMSACSDSQPTSSQNATTRLSQSLQNGGEEFAAVVKGQPLQFPQDHAAHPEFRQEWWYLTANLKNEQGQDIGLQWTQFRVSLDNKLTPQHGWQTGQLFMAHAAVTSESQHEVAERWERQHPELADVANSPLQVFLHNWRWQSQSDQLLPATLTVKDDKFEYQLSLSSDAPIHKQGQQGYSQKHATQPIASYYYSQPFIKISGKVRINDTWHMVQGEGWLDREWSSQFLDKSQAGWDWFALTINPDEKLMVYRLRGNPDYVYANIMNRDGSQQQFNNTNVTLKVTETFSKAGHNYPIGWQLSISDTPIDLEVKAINSNSEMALSLPYWEGPVTVTGSHQGIGYLEMTGY